MQMVLDGREGIMQINEVDSVREISGAIVQCLMQQKFNGLRNDVVVMGMIDALTLVIKTMRPDLNTADALDGIVDMVSKIRDVEKGLRNG